MEVLALIDYLTYYVNIVSLSCATLMIIFMTVVLTFSFKAANRLSYKLYVWIAWTDFLFSLSAHFRLNYRLFIDPTSRFIYGMSDQRICAVIHHSSQLVNIWFIFLTTAMAFNLQTVFLKSKYFPALTHWLYGLLTLALALVMIIPSLAYGIYSDNCYGLTQKKLMPWNFVHFYVTNGIPTLVCCLYCAYVFIAVVVKLCKDKVNFRKVFHSSKNDCTNGSQTLNSSNSSNTTNSAALTHQARTGTALMNRFASRLVAYAIVPIITQLPYVIYSIPTAFKPDQDPVRIAITNIGGVSCGWLNFILFLFDPAFIPIFVELKQRIKNPKNFQFKDQNDEFAKKALSDNPFHKIDIEKKKAQEKSRIKSWFRSFKIDSDVQNEARKSDQALAEQGCFNDRNTSEDAITGEYAVKFL